MSLSLPDSPRKLIFRTLVDLFQQDPILKATIAPGSWYVWDGSITSNTPWGTGLFPAAQITPLAIPATAETVAQQNSPFGIQLVIGTFGLNVDDLLDLWSAFENVVFTGDGTKTTTTALQAVLTASASPFAVGASVQTTRLGMPAIQLDMNEAEQRFLGQVAQAAKTNWQAAAWWLERRKHEDFGRREKVDMTLDAKKDAERVAAGLGLDADAVLAEAERILKESTG